MERTEIFTTFAIGEQAFITIIDEEMVEVILLDEVQSGEYGQHKVAYRYNGQSQDGEWELGTIEDAYDYAEETLATIQNDAKQQAEWDAIDN